PDDSGGPTQRIQTTTERPGGAHPAENTREYELTPIEELLKVGDPPEFIVEGLFETHSVVGLIGAPEAGKSLLMLEMGLCVALAQPFHGRKCKRGLVVYLAGEGQHGLRARLQALE